VKHTANTTFNTSGGVSTGNQYDSFNLLGDLIDRVDTSNVEHEYTYDGFGRLLTDHLANLTTMAPNVNATVRTIKYTYNPSGQLAIVDSLDASNNLKNQVTRSYNGFGQVTYETTSSFSTATTV